MAPKCQKCLYNTAMLKRPKTGQPYCKDCFFVDFEQEIHETIIKEKMFISGEIIALGASGGKDSTVLIHIMKILNTRYNYDVKFILISIDEGITGYRDDSLKTVHQNQQEYGFPLKVASYKELYGWTMDEIVRKMGTRNNCTVCGVFRRQALDRAALKMNATKIATGHNADDMAETVLMNVLRGDYNRMIRCTSSITNSANDLQESGVEALPRCKPLKYCYEKEIVMYAHYKKLLYFATECTYAPNSFRGHVRAFLKDLERLNPRSIHDIIQSGEDISKPNCIITTKHPPLDDRLPPHATLLEPNTHTPLLSPNNDGSCSVLENYQTLQTHNTVTSDTFSPCCKGNLGEGSSIATPYPLISTNNAKLQLCSRCSYISSQTICKACTILEGLSLDLPLLGIGKPQKALRHRIEKHD